MSGDFTRTKTYFWRADIAALAAPVFSDLHQQRSASSPALIRSPQTCLHQGELRAATLTTLHSVNDDALSLSGAASLSTAHFLSELIQPAVTIIEPHGVGLPDRAWLL